MRTDKVLEIDGIRFWKASKDSYFVKVPYNRKGVMNGRKPFGEYYRNGILKYMQYETSIDEAEQLMKSHKTMEV